MIALIASCSLAALAVRHSDQCQLKLFIVITFQLFAVLKENQNQRRKRKMSDSKKLKELYDAAPFLTQATICFAACTRTICESSLSSDIKGDALSLALQYYEAAIRTDMCERFLKTEKKEGVSLEMLIGAFGLDSLDKMEKKQAKLKNIMELF
jgi:hypothetical protein